jgi:soluble lytic murein transglycosylase-like protein
MKRVLLTLWLASCAWPAWSGPVDDTLRLAVKQAVEDSTSFKDRFQAQVWLADMSERLASKIPNPFYRVDLLRLVHEEAVRAKLRPEVVLAVIQVESNFDRFAISETGAQGLMQVMPFWKKEIGHPRDNLFKPRTNLRYGCTILKHYLIAEHGNLNAALARYNGSQGQRRYVAKVHTALRNRWYPQ